MDSAADARLYALLRGKGCVEPFDDPQREPGGFQIEDVKVLETISQSVSGTGAVLVLTTAMKPLVLKVAGSSLHADFKDS